MRGDFVRGDFVFYFRIYVVFSFHLAYWLCFRLISVYVLVLLACVFGHFYM